MDKELVLMAGAPLAAVGFFIAVYAKNYTKYLKLLAAAKDVINGRFKTGMFFYTIKLEGEYKGRPVICCLEQTQGGKELLFVKMKPMPPEVSRVTLKDYPVLTDEVMLYEGWLAPRFYLSSRYFDRESFIKIMEKVLKAAQKLEQGLNLDS